MTPSHVVHVRTLRVDLHRLAACVLHHARYEGKIDAVYEPVVNATVIAPSDYTGAIMELCQSRRGQLGGMDYLSESRVELRYTLPLGEIIFDFFDALKSRTRGYASLDYSEAGEQESSL